VTRRECILAAIAHKESDRIPVDLGGMRSTGITAIAYGRLKRHLGIRTVTSSAPCRPVPSTSASSFSRSRIGTATRPSSKNFPP